MKNIKRSLSLILSLIIIFSGLYSCSFSTVKGDTDLNGSVEAADARLALRASVGLEELNEKQIQLADIDKNGEITAADARSILRISVNLSDSFLEVHFIDVGQADSALIMCGGSSMLIDGGNVADSSLTVSHLLKAGIEELDYVVCTHAHEDHVGGLSGPLNKFPVKKAVFAPETGADTKCYRDFLTAVRRQGKEIETPAPGYTFSLGDATATVLGPVKETPDNINNTSIVIKITYGSTSFLFTGDAEYEEEHDILNSGADLSADVLKVCHHGSSTSTSYSFLRAVNPAYAVISCGKDNKYGHPHEEVLSRLRDADTKVYRTDLQGDIIIISDGSTLKITTQKNGDINTNPTLPDPGEAMYIGNKNSKIFHKSTCSRLPKESNRIYFYSRADAVNAGYRPCKNCNP